MLIPIIINRTPAMATKAKRKSASSSKPTDAIALLKADHRQVEDWFSQFEKTKSESKRQRLATSICDALTVHTMIEEEIFYPAFIQSTGDKAVHHEAIVEHDAAKALIAQIEEMSAGDDYFAAKVKVLSEMIKHHVKEEEKAGGMFAEAKRSGLNLQELGKELLARKHQIQAESEAA
jgi:hemerythrin superfamily protein